ncbi:GFA family protein [Loktanella agnita]|uniref:GFA family protein n=1 Tax=Loktanella agnita TaxID=287097 RepID=UPI0039863881
MKGACNCGAVAFRVDADLRDVYVCHCSICRRYSGAQGIAVVVVPNAAFAWLHGQDNIRSWDKPGADWQAHFCVTCGSALPGPNDPDRMFIPAGLLDGDDAGMAVAHHIWVGSKAAWDEIGDDGQQHPEGFGSAPG